MVIAIIDTRQTPDLCADLVRRLLPRATCLITPSVHEIWKTDVPVPPLSGLLINEGPQDLPSDDEETLVHLSQRFPVASIGSAEDTLRAWAARCLDFEPQLPRQPDRLPWKSAVVVTFPERKSSRMCSTDNVSLGGLYIEDPRSKPSVGTRLSLRFPSFGGPVASAAVVRWVQPRSTAARPSGYGCQFVDHELWVPGVLVNTARMAQPAL
ncbi:MAG: PilZ domain-containing protein [Deltaproteobacteria bacterium]|nr:PilZ domain-containing protein [Deltaproteobacteria bacterium]